MINYTDRLNYAICVAARAHEKQGQHRKGTDIPYIIHPFGVMLIASNVTDDEDVLIACLMHDVLEDVASDIYSEDAMRRDFGDRVVAMVKDVTKDDTEKDWRKRSEVYLTHLEHEASDGAVVVSASDKLQNLLTTLVDLEIHGEALWQRFTTKSGEDQLWWYQSILTVIERRSAPAALVAQLADAVSELSAKLPDTAGNE